MTEIKPVVDIFSKLLAANGFTRLHAEAFRQAKYDRETPIESLWRLLAEILIIQQAGWTVQSQLSESCNKIILEDKERIKLFVKRHLLAQWYSRKSVSMLDCGSRSLLVALGWLLAKTNALDELMKAKLDRQGPEWEDLFSSPSAANASSSIDSIFNNPLEFIHSNIRITCDRLCWLWGKIRMTTRNVHSKYQEKVKLSAKMSAKTELMQESRLPPILYLKLLTQPALQDKFAKLLREENEILTLYCQWKEKEHLFWKWMSSIVAEHEKYRTTSSHEDDNSVSKTSEDAITEYEKLSIEGNATAKVPQASCITETNFVQYKKTTNDRLPIVTELCEQLSEQKGELKAKLDETQKQSSQILAELGDKLEGVLCIPPLRSNPPTLGHSVNSCQQKPF